MPSRIPAALLVVSAALLLAGCSDQGVSAVKFDAIAVVQGDFDDVGEPLVALEINTQPYNGFIVQATYMPEDDRLYRDDPGPTLEGLLTNVMDNGRLELNLYNAVFVNSGTRGLGGAVYNNQLESDDALLADAEAVENVCAFVEAGGSLIVSDWAYDLVERCWPDNIEFFGDDLTPDAAQAGIPDGAVLAEVRSESLVDALGSEVVSIAYDYTAWSVIESVNADTEVLLRGPIEYQPASDQLPVPLADAPLLVRFKPGRGQVVYSTFHWAAQTSSVAQSLLLATVEGLEEGAGEDTPDAVQVEN